MAHKAGASKIADVTVLVLDASAHVRARLLAMIAEVGGIRAHEASDAETALLALDEFEIDVVVLDVHLPENDGLGLLRSIRERAPAIVSIVLTNEAGEHHRRECLSHGANFFFDKSRHFERAVGVVKELAPLLSRRLTAPS